MIPGGMGALDMMGGGGGFSGGGSSASGSTGDQSTSSGNRTYLIGGKSEMGMGTVLAIGAVALLLLLKK